MKNISIFIATFIIIGFFFLAMPEKGYSQEIELGCCQYGEMDTPGEATNLEFTNESNCTQTTMLKCDIGLGGEFFKDETCNENTGYCIDPIREVPTLSEWGLITMAGVLGIIGFMVIRRRKVTA